MPRKIKAWHFLADDYRLKYGDRRKVQAGSRLVYDGVPKLCCRGFHGSRRVIDALQYAPGPIVCRVVISGDIVEGDDKLVGGTREILWTLDATWELHHFACWCAERALKHAKVTDARSWKAIETKRLWIDGLATDDELSAARSAAWSAARGVVDGDAARGAAWSTARNAVGSAIWSTATAWSTARSANNRKLTSLLNAAEYA